MKPRFFSVLASIVLLGACATTGSDRPAQSEPTKPEPGDDDLERLVPASGGVTLTPIAETESKAASTPAKTELPAPAAASDSALFATEATEPGPTRTPDVIYLPTPQPVVDKMLELADVKKDDLVYDLGCGDGRIVVTAAKRYGVRAIGFDIDPKRVTEARENVRKNGVEHLVTIEHEDIFTLDLSPATVVMLYLLPDLNVRLIPQLQKLKPGARIVSHDFAMSGVRAVKHLKFWPTGADREHEVYFWTAPIKRQRAAAR